MMIEKCKECKNWDIDDSKPKNKIKCVFSCDEYQEYQSRKIFEYNRAVSGDEFDTTELHEHGKKVYGSGWKNK